MTEQATISSINEMENMGGFVPMALKNPDGTQELVVNERGFVQITNYQGLVTNSLLRKDEWEQLDAMVQIAATGQLNAIARLDGDASLRKPLGSIGVVVAQYNQGSEMTRPAVNLTGRGAPSLDRQNYNLTGVPIPVIHKEFQIGTRELAASRAYGSGIDATNAFEASRVVAQEMERIYFVGNTNISLNQDVLYGVTNEPNINGGAAVGDFGVLANQVPTFRNMIQAANADNYFGPFEFWVARTQYNEMSLAFYTDGSGESGLQRILRMEGVDAVHPSDWMTAGTLVMVQMTPNVIDFCVYQMGTVVEWTTPDGMAQNFKIMSIGAPRVKSDYNNASGIVYFTGA